MPSNFAPIVLDPGQFWAAIFAFFSGIGTLATWAIKQVLARFDSAISTSEKNNEKLCKTFEAEIKACHEGRKEEHAKLLETIIELSKGKQP